jgi:glycosyltransferase involved in cell wall biosynthesis
MISKTPRVSIGLPVYNGEEFISEALDSLLNQSFCDFELIISDNASTDRTENICQDYAHKDKRIRYFRNQRNVGMFRNFNRVLELSRGEYFKWAAHDDICSPRFLEECVRALDSDQSVILCFTRTKVTDKDGLHLFSPGSFLGKADSLKAEERFGDVLSNLVACDHLFGLIRTDVLKKTGKYSNYWTADKGLIAELSLWGRFAEIEQELLSRRSHAAQATEASLEDKYKFINPHRRDPLPYQIYATTRYISSIRRSSLSTLKKLRCYFLVLKQACKYEKIKVFFSVVYKRGFV